MTTDELNRLDRLSALYGERVSAQEVTHPGYAEVWAQLSGALLAHGGDLVVPPLDPEPHAAELLAGLRTWPGKGAKLIKGAPNRCHENSARLWVTGKASALATGYALSEDGLWRQHSWSLTDADKVLETTVRRQCYAGFLLEEHQAMQFAFFNMPPAELAALVGDGARPPAVAAVLDATSGQIGSPGLG